MQKINLLPQWARRKKALRQQIIILAIAQIVIFLVLAGAFFVLNWRERHIWEYSRQLQARIASFPESAMEAAAELQAARLHIMGIDEFFAEAFPSTLCMQCLIYILDAFPQGATLYRVDYMAHTLTITATSENIYIAEIHRVSLAEIFPEVHAGSITRLENGHFSYELIIPPGDCLC